MFGENAPRSEYTFPLLFSIKLFEGLCILMTRAETVCPNCAVDNRAQDGILPHSLAVRP